MKRIVLLFCFLTSIINANPQNNELLCKYNEMVLKIDANFFTNRGWGKTFQYNSDSNCNVIRQAHTEENGSGGRFKQGRYGSTQNCSGWQSRGYVSGRKIENEIARSNFDFFEIGHEKPVI